MVDGSDVIEIAEDVFFLRKIILLLSYIILVGWLRVEEGGEGLEEGNVGGRVVDWRCWSKKKVLPMQCIIIYNVWYRIILYQVNFFDFMKVSDNVEHYRFRKVLNA